jgi:hypothetical protein
MLGKLKFSETSDAAQAVDTQDNIVAPVTITAQEKAQMEKTLVVLAGTRAKRIITKQGCIQGLWPCDEPFDCQIYNCTACVDLTRKDSFYGWF